jgi:hypothetical protein
MKRLTYVNGFRLDGQPAQREEVRSIFNKRITQLWDEYEQRKALLLDSNLTPEQYQLACRNLARELGL